MTDTVLAPVRVPGRIALLDSLRGVALLGIFLMNVELFSTSMQDVSAGIGPDLAGADRLADAFVYTLVAGKFWPLFSMLFGTGFAVMWLRALEAGRPFGAMYLRRVMGLMAIGLAHGVLVWAGDILFAYAMTAVLLVAFFRDTPVPRLWKWGVALYGTVAGLVLLAAATSTIAAGDPDMAARIAEDAAAAASARAAEIATYASGTWREANAIRWRHFMEQLPGLLALVPMALGMFLVGAWCVRSGALVAPERHRGLFARWAGWGLGLGGALTLASLAVDPVVASDPAAPSGRPLLASALHLLGGPLMTLGYVGLVVLAWLRGVRWLDVLAPAGRMALTNYLLQSVVGTLVFYGYGLGLWGQVSRAGQTLLVLVVFALQVVASRAWLRHFRYGPAEWLWRAFTYWRWPAMRRAAPVPA